MSDYDIPTKKLTSEQLLVLIEFNSSQIRLLNHAKAARIVSIGVWVLSFFMQDLGALLAALVLWVIGSSGTPLCEYRKRHFKYPEGL